MLFTTRAVLTCPNMFSRCKKRRSTVTDERVSGRSRVKSHEDIPRENIRPPFVPFDGRERGE